MVLRQVAHRLFLLPVIVDEKRCSILPPGLLRQWVQKYNRSVRSTAPGSPAQRSLVPLSLFHHQKDEQKSVLFLYNTGSLHCLNRHTYPPQELLLSTFFQTILLVLLFAEAWLPA